MPSPKGDASMSEVLNFVERYPQIVNNPFCGRIICHEFDREKGLISHPNILKGDCLYFIFFLGGRGDTRRWDLKQ